MGQAKAMLPWGKSSLLLHLTIIFQLRVDPLIVVSDGQMAFPALPPTVQLVDDPILHQGPLAGFSNGLKQAPTDRPVFLTGCDFPFIQPTIVDYLLDQIGDADAIVTQTAGILQPLIGLYQPSVFPIVQRLIATGTRSITALLDTISCKTILDEEWRQFDHSGLMLMNINTPEEYELAHRQFLNITSSMECS